MDNKQYFVSVSEYMSFVDGTRTFTEEEVMAIRRAIRYERNNRTIYESGKKIGIFKPIKTTEERLILNKRVAQIANELLERNEKDENSINGEIVAIYKSYKSYRNHKSDTYIEKNLDAKKVVASMSFNKKSQKMARKQSSVIKFMNLMDGTREFTEEEVKAIRKGIQIEQNLRTTYEKGKKIGILEPIKTTEERLILNKRVAQIANELLGRNEKDENSINGEIVALYKSYRNHKKNTPAETCVVAKNIADYMTLSHEERDFNHYETSAIGNAINIEQKNRIMYNDLGIGHVKETARKKIEKEKLNERIAEIANELLVRNKNDKNAITGGIVKLYKRCRYLEYEDRLSLQREC